MQAEWLCVGSGPSYAMNIDIIVADSFQLQQEN